MWSQFELSVDRKTRAKLVTMNRSSAAGIDAGANNYNQDEDEDAAAPQPQPDPAADACAEGADSAVGGHGDAPHRHNAQVRQKPLTYLMTSIRGRIVFPW